MHILGKACCSDTWDCKSNWLKYLIVTVAHEKTDSIRVDVAGQTGSAEVKNSLLHEVQASLFHLLLALGQVPILKPIQIKPPGHSPRLPN